MACETCLPLIDLSSADRTTAAKSIRQACLDYGFFYLLNHGIEKELFENLFAESRKFFSLPIEVKMEILRSKNHRGYTPMYSETLDPSSKFQGDLKEGFYIGPLGSKNQWPSQEILPSWRATMETYYEKILTVGKNLLSLIALALNLDEQFFERIGALHNPAAFLRLLHYPEESPDSDNGNFGASAHSDYGMITLLVTDGVPGLQICRDKNKEPRLWEDVNHIDGAIIVNIGDMLERWTNCLFRSTLHRVLATGKERYSVPFFLDPNPEFLVECLETCCSEKSPPRFPPIRSGDYLQERLRVTYAKMR